MKNETLLKWLPTAIAIVIIAVYRLLPHPWNFAPVCATAIFGGIYLNKRLALILPIASMFAADIFLGLDWVVTPVIYGCILLSAVVGFWIRGSYEQKSVFAFKAIGGTLFSSIVFFVMTNFVSWLTLDMYTKDWTGLVSCYTLAIPFFGNTLAGDTLFITVFIGVYEAVQAGVQLMLKPQTVRSVGE